MALTHSIVSQRFLLIIHTLFITYDKQYFVTLRTKYLISKSMSESKRIKPLWYRFITKKVWMKSLPNCTKKE